MPDLNFSLMLLLFKFQKASKLVNQTTRNQIDKGQLNVYVHIGSLPFSPHKNISF